MRIDIVTVSPELIRSPFEHSILKRAQDKGKVEVHFHGLRDYALNRYGKIDDYQFSMWVSNGFEYLSIKGFMIIPLTESEQETIWKRVVEFKEDNLKLIIKRKEEELDELKNKLS